MSCRPLVSWRDFATEMRLRAVMLQSDGPDGHFQDAATKMLRASTALIEALDASDEAGLKSADGTKAHGTLNTNGESNVG